MSFFSPMQQEFWQEAVQGGHRWNVKTGATRSGKTYQDYFLIPRRLLAVAGKEGLNVILGNTRETIQRDLALVGRIGMTVIVKNGNRIAGQSV